jgi:hypothetical protein
MQSIVRKLEHDAAPLECKRTVPGPLGAAIMAALSRDAAKRPTAAVLAAELAKTDDKAPVVPPVAATAASSSKLKLVAGVLGAAAVIALIVLATRGSSSTSASRPSHVPEATWPAAAKSGAATNESPDEPSASQDETAGQDPAQDTMPTFVDQYGNPIEVDEETAKQLLEQMQHDASESVRGRGRGRGKKKR